MRSVDVPKPGGPEALVIAERPVPSPGPTELLIKVAAAGLNRADILQRRGFYPSPAGAPTYPGLEVSGTVAAAAMPHGNSKSAMLYARCCRAVAMRSTASSMKRRCCRCRRTSTWSRPPRFPRLISPSGAMLRLRAAATEGVFAGSWRLERHRRRRNPAGAGKGQVVLTTAGSDDKCRFCVELGATRAINYRSEDFVDVVGRETQGRGVDVVLDMIGGSYLARNLQVLAVEGRLVIIATQGGNQGEVDVLRVMQRRLAIMGSTLRARDTAFKRRIRDELRAHVWPLFDSGALRPIVDRVFPLEQAAQAHAYMESGAHKGKILLALSP